MGITIYFQITAIVVVVIGILLRIYRQKKQVNKYSRELNATVMEAKSVCEDLTGIMEDALSVSQIIIDDIDKKIVDADQAIEDIDQKIAGVSSLCLVIPDELGVVASSAPANKVTHSLADRVRVYHLAQEVGMPSKQMVSFIRSLGMEVVNHMNCLDDEQVIAIQKALQTGARPVFKALEQASVGALNLQPDIVEISKPHLVASDADHRWLKTGQQSSGNSSDHIVSIEDLKKAHPYLAVRMLRERGYSIRDIAQMLDRGQGEVSLIINLSARKQACS